MTNELEYLLKSEEIIVQEIESNLTTFASVFGWGKYRNISKPKIAYASSPITTGHRMYTLFKEHNVHSIEELKKINPELFKKEIFLPNLIDGENFAQQLRDQKKYDYVISPATFFAKGWAQEHYMSFWERVIETFATAIHFNKGWNFSNGCVEEYLIGRKKNKSLYNGVELVPIPEQDALNKIKMSIIDIGTLGVDFKQLYNLYRRIEIIVFNDEKDNIQINSLKV